MTVGADIRQAAPLATDRGLVVRGVGAFPVTPTPASTTTVNTKLVVIANSTVLAANINRLGASFFNNSVSNCFLKLGANASIVAGAESFTVRLVPYAYYEVPYGYTGIIDAIWDALDATGELLVTEFSA